MTKPSAPNPFILGLTILLGIAVGYLFYAQTSGDTGPLPPPATLQDAAFLKFQNARLDFSILEDPAFQILRTFGEYPIQPGVTGKADPFAP